MKHSQPICAKVKQIVKQIKGIETPLLDGSQLNRLSEIFADVGQVFFATMVVAPFITGLDKLSWPVIVSGMIASLVFWMLSIWVAKRK